MLYLALKKMVVLERPWSEEMQCFLAMFPLVCLLTLYVLHYIRTAAWVGAIMLRVDPFKWDFFKNKKHLCITEVDQCCVATGREQEIENNTSVFLVFMDPAIS